MKWMILGLIAAVVLIGAGVVLTNGEGGNQAVSGSPEAILLCESGTEDLHAFRLRDAVSKLGRCLELDGSLAEASISRALAFYRLGEMDNFRNEVVRADSLTALVIDDDRRMLAELRLSAIGSSRFYAFRDSLMERLGQEMPENIHVLVAQANQASMSEDEEVEEQAWKRILDVDPNYANSYNMLGYFELKRGNYDQAIDYMQKYAFLAPGLANPHDSLGEVLMVLGRYEEAEAEFRSSVKIQPDFYHSWINLGKTYLARGQIKTGLDILEKVRGLVAGSDIEKRVDREIVGTFLVAGLDKELDRMTAVFIDRYPDDGTSAFYRGMRLAHMGELQQGQAVMDSTLTAWRMSDDYKKYEKARQSVERAAREYDALVAELVDDPATAARMWSMVVDMGEATRPFHETWFERIKLARNLHQSGRPTEALDQITPILEVNPRVTSALELAVECYIDMGRIDEAGQALEQLKWSVSNADADYPALQKVEVLERNLTVATGSP